MDASAAPRRARPAWTLALTSVAFFMVALDALVVTTALPAVHRDLGGSLSSLEWVVNAYLLAFAATIIPAAAIADRLGRRPVYVAGLTLFVTASALCALAPATGELIAARALQGVGAGVVTPLSLTILTAAFPAQRRGAVLGAWGAIAGLAVACGPLVGGAVTQGLSWHWIFWVNVPIGALAAVLSPALLASSRGPRARLDGVGAVLVGAAAVALAYGLVRVADLGWLSGTVAGALAAGAALLAAFVAWERRAPEPMLPPRLFAHPAFAAAVATAFFMSAAITAAAFLVSQYFQLGLGLSPLATAVRFLPWTAAPLLVAPLAGRLSDRLGHRPFLVIGLSLQGAGLLAVAGLAGIRAGYALLVAPLAVAGIGVSMAIPTAAAAALSAVSPADIGKAAGATNSLQRFGGVFGVAAVSAVFAASGHLTSPVAVVAGFRPALAVAAAFSFLGSLTALAVTSRRQAAGAARPEPVAAVAGAA
jgi:EmrB/QacA subfamily drug resistance transporter